MLYWLVLERKVETSKTRRSPARRNSSTSSNMDRFCSVFHGQVMHFASFDEVKKSSGHLQIFEKRFASTISGWTAEHEIHTEDEAFNHRFRVFAADEHNAFYILTPRMLEQITQFADHAGAQKVACWGRAQRSALCNSAAIPDLPFRPSDGFGPGTNV